MESWERGIRIEDAVQQVKRYRLQLLIGLTWVISLKLGVFIAQEGYSVRWLLLSNMVFGAWPAFMLGTCLVDALCWRKKLRNLRSEVDG